MAFITLSDYKQEAVKEFKNFSLKITERRCMQKRIYNPLLSKLRR